MMLAIDEAWTKTPADQLGPYMGTFVYISRDASKCATDAYIAAVHAQGKGVGFVFEDYAGRWRGGRSVGVIDGQFANSWADTHGVPDNLPLYVAVDQDITTEADMLTALAYVSGFGSVRRQGRGYGEFDLIERLAAVGIDHDWQTCAWSAGRISGHAAVYQAPSHTYTIPGSYDEDRVLDPTNSGLWFPTPVTNSKDRNMYMQRTPDGGISLINGGAVIHIRDEAHRVFYASQGVPTWNVQQADGDAAIAAKNALAAIAAFVANPGTTVTFPTLVATTTINPAS